MKKLFFKPVYVFFVLLLTIAATSCDNATAKNELKAEEFKHMLDVTANKIVLDVRTPGEYAEGHLQEAMNIDWNGEVFESEAEKLDKSKPLFVYCLAGSRSAAAAEKLRKMGFKEVYELKGGILKWRASGFPEAGASNAVKGMTSKDFEAILNTDKKVLVDFYATWCGPCKQMEPSLKAIAQERDATVKVVRIDVDENPTLAAELKVDKLPTLFIYNKQQLVWHVVGFQRKSDLETALDAVK